MTEAPLPEFWTKVLDESSGNDYYYHTGTNEVSWDRPQNDAEEVPVKQKKKKQKPAVDKASSDDDLEQSPKKTKKKSAREKKRELEKTMGLGGKSDDDDIDLSLTPGNTDALDEDDLLELQHFVDKKKMKTESEGIQELEEEEHVISIDDEEVGYTDDEEVGYTDDDEVGSAYDDDQGSTDDDEEGSAYDDDDDDDQGSTDDEDLVFSDDDFDLGSTDDELEQGGSTEDGNLKETKKSAREKKRELENKFASENDIATAEATTGKKKKKKKKTKKQKEKQASIRNLRERVKEKALTRNGSPGGTQTTVEMSESGESLNFNSVPSKKKKKKSMQVKETGLTRKLAESDSICETQTTGDSGSLDSVDYNSKGQRPTKTKRVVQMRNTDGLIGGKPGMERQDSSRPGAPGMQRQGSVRPNNNRPRSSHQLGKNGEQRPMQRAQSVQGQQRQGPTRGVQRTRSQEGPQLHRANTMNPMRPPVARQLSTRPQQMRQPSQNRPLTMRQQSQMMQRGPSQPSMDRQQSRFDQRPLSTKSMRMDPEQAGPPPPPPRKKKKDDYEQPPKSLVLVWLVVAGELGFDLGTTVIAFRSLLEESNCCDIAIKVGPVPMGTTVPFFLLIIAELAMLIQAIMLTLFPNIMMTDEDDERPERSTFMTWFCCCLRWKVRMLMRFLGFLVLLNPFFGCVIAWMLLYQSDKKDAFIVLGFEGGSLLLHFVSVYLEGAIIDCTSFICQALVPLVPFLASIGLVGFYLKQGGVCYSVEKRIFAFNGCEVCIDGIPPVEGICYLKNGTNVTFDIANVLDIDNLNEIEDITARTNQTTYCSSDNPGGPEVDFCFFDYSVGGDDDEDPTSSPEFDLSELQLTNTTGDS